MTGSTRGIGLAIAKALIAAGDDVMVTGRDSAGVDGAVRGLSAGAAAAGRAVGQVMDLRDRASIDRAVAAAAAAFGGLDVVVNNAGVGIYGDLETVSDEDWRTVMETNVTGPFQVMRAAIPRLREAGGGWIINIASLAGANPFAGGGAYCASKAALIALTESAMQELRNDNIRVSVVLPGSTATKFSGRSGGDDSWKLSPDDVAEVVVDLLRHPARSLPSRVEIRPARPRKG
ncbi:MAG: SDR family NAD(P)-dependent oxidoreductase [Acidobacteria bacterium]|nr:SDR family NAD(P)-dependent oxidoreductase [Acidobacteriota bacterium]